MSRIVRSLLLFAIGTAIFVGLPLVAWGVGDIRGFLSHPGRSGYAVLTVMMQIFIAVRMPEAGSARGTKSSPLRSQRLTLALLQILPLAIVILAPRCDALNVLAIGGPDWMRYAGLAMYVSGMSLMQWAEAALGKQFSVEVVIQDGHRLVTDGPFRYIRPPRYLGIIVLSAGVSLVFSSWAGLFIMGALATILGMRIRDEEAVLRRAFGGEWDAYEERTWCLAPFVY